MLQLRRFRDAQGSLVTVREQVAVDACGGDVPNFELAFLGVEGELAGSAVTQKWQQTYSRFDKLFFLHSSFHVKDLGKAAVNYQLHDFGPIVRANRSARRFVVWPQQLDKSVWLVDVDMQTSVPLYCAEFDPHMRMLSEVEGLSFTPATPTVAVAASSIVALADFSAATSYLGHPNGLVDPNVLLTSEYTLGQVEVRDDPLNGRQKLVMTYTDGIDEFMIVQTPNTPDAFASLQARSGKGAPSASLGHTIARYRDPAMSVLIFWEDGVSFQVAGRGSLQRLDELARQLYLQARSN
ncbi:MAG: hypothetical protein K8J09_18385 [Planctomycetes bacterium]|nr:hypothetical protein [Planctomycetota bacterium]